MSQDEEQQRRSRVVVETPTTRREVVQTQTTHAAPDRGGFSTGMVAAVALAAIAATAIIFLFLMNSGDDETNVNINARPAAQPSTVVVQQPAVQPTPIIIQQAPPMTTQPAPVIITQPAETAPAPVAAASNPPSPPDDSTVQTNVSRKIQEDTELGSTDINASVSGGKATLTGTVSTQTLKRRAERVALAVKGVRTVDNQIEVTGGAEATSTP